MVLETFRFPDLIAGITFVRNEENVKIKKTGDHITLNVEKTCLIFNLVHSLFIFYNLSSSLTTSTLKNSSPAVPNRLSSRRSFRYYDQGEINKETFPEPFLLKKMGFFESSISISFFLCSNGVTFFFFNMIPKYSVLNFLGMVQNIYLVLYKHSLGSSISVKF